MDNLVKYDRLVNETTQLMIKKYENYKKLLKTSKVSNETKKRHSELENQKHYVVETILNDLKKKNKKYDSYHMSKDAKDVKALTDYLGIE